MRKLIGTFVQFLVCQAFIFKDYRNSIRRFFHLFFNMFALWMFGTDLERQWGTKEFLKFYFVTGIGAGIITFLLTISTDIPTVGASGAIFGVLVAFAMRGIKHG